LENTDQSRGENDPTHYLLFGERQQRQTSGGGEYRGDRARRTPTPAETSRAIAAAEPPAGWIDDSEQAIQDLKGGGQ
jgi:hypothetical protein